MSFSARLKELRAKMGLKQREFAELAGVSVRAQAAYEAGDRLPDAAYLTAVARAGGDVMELMLGEAGSAEAPGIVRVRSTLVPGHIDQPEIVPIQTSDYLWVPVLDVQAQGGDGREPGAETIIGHNAYRRQWLEKRGLLSDELIQIGYVGESMHPEFQDGDTLLVSISESKKHITGGDIYVIRMDGELIVKYVSRLPGDRIQVSSANPAFPPFEIAASELSTDDTSGAGSVTVIGKVVHQGRDR